MSQASTSPVRIVIIGGGYTGIWGYNRIHRRLKKQIRRGEVQVTVISPKSYHSFHGWTAEAVTGIVGVASRQSPLRRLFKDATVLRAQAESVDLEKQLVTVRHIADDHVEQIPYDHLLFANGSYDNLERVPGLEQYGWSLKEAGGVLATRNQLIHIMEAADGTRDSDAQQQFLTVVVAGGGFAGVEITAAIAELFRAWRKFYPVLQKLQPRIVLVHSGPSLLKDLRPKYAHLADYATKELENYGVDIRLNTRVTEITAEGAQLSDGDFIASRTVLSTVGQRRVVMPGTESLPRVENGQLDADEFLRIDGYDNLWGGGDAARVMHISGNPCPTNALWAIMHGVWAGDNIGLTILNKPLHRFTYRGLGQAASLGIGKGASELYGRQFTGWIGWFLRFFFFLYFQPSRRQAVRVFLDWISLPFLGRYMNPLETSGRTVKAGISGVAELDPSHMEIA